MTRRVVLTAVGPDRPGLVAEVSEFVFVRGGSIEESRMVNLLGQFAIAMLVSGGDEAIERLAAELDRLAEATGIEPRLSPASASAAAGPGYRLVARALDQPGLVHEVAAALRRVGANVESLETGLEPAPMSGAPVFTMEIAVTLLRDVPRAEFERELARVCEPLDITWTLAPEDAPAPVNAT